MKTDGKNLLLNTEMNFPESADKDRHLMRYTLLQEKNHHMAFLSQFWPLSDHSAFRELHLIRTEKPNTGCFPATAMLKIDISQFVSL